jgi:hypothetical protein
MHNCVKILYYILGLFLGVRIFFVKLYGKGKAVPLPFQIGPKGSRILKLPGISENWHIKLARLSALRTDHPYVEGKIPGTVLVEDELLHGHSASGRIK